MVEQTEERRLCESRLDYYRGVVISKCDGLNLEQAALRLGPSLTSMAGIVKHLTNVERWWFRRMLDGEDLMPPGRETGSRDPEFVVAADDTLESLIVEYEMACRESREIAGAHGLDDLMVRNVDWLHGRPESLRWLYGHMITETARHCGHLDIYRELLDGRIGLD